MVVNEADPLEVDLLGVGGAPYYPGTLALAVKAYESRGILWPVSGDKIAVDPTAADRRAFTPKQGPRRVLAAGRIEWCRCLFGVACFDCGDE